MNPHALELTSIQAHRVGGVAAVIVAALSLLTDRGHIRPTWVRALTGAALLAWGVRSMTHPLPAGAEATAAHEGSQHILIGLAAALVGAIELLRAVDRLKDPAWDFACPAGLGALGVLFFVHAQHGDPMAAAFLSAQHRVIGATLAIAALLSGGAVRPSRWQERLRFAFSVLVLLFGLELLVYSEGAPMTTPHHGVVGTLLSDCTNERAQADPRASPRDCVRRPAGGAGNSRHHLQHPLWNGQRRA
jgi:uncharacterized membrane protein HdeD (DUF308 family)